VIVLTTLMACIVAGVGIYLTPRTYSASATVRVAQVPVGSTDYVDIDYAERLVNTYVKVLRSRPILEKAIQRLELDTSTKDLSSRVWVEAIVNTELIAISVEDDSPWRARDIANTLADLIVEQAQSLYAGGGRSAREILQEQLNVVESNVERDRADLESLIGHDASGQGEVDALSRKIALEEETYALLLRQYEQARVAEAMRANSITIVDPAIPPETPRGPSRTLVILVAVLVGLLAGTALALLLEYLDTTIYTVEQLQDTAGLPILGKIPQANSKASTSRKTAVIYDNGSPQEEAFRLLRASIFPLNRNAPHKTLLITSAEQRVGKTTVVANLARAVAQTGRKVVVVDGDLRLPVLHQVFGIPNESGLSNVLEQRASIREALQATEVAGLGVITSGPARSHPIELLESPEMRTVVDNLVDSFDFVFFNSPPLLAAADAVILSAMVEDVAVVAELGQTKQESLQAVLNQLAHIKVNLIGIIVDRTD
jgi:non-specific protein-tyrosine kinase